MNPTRRALAFGIPALMCWPVLARAAVADPIADYERATGGRIGVHALNVRTGKTLSWRADERFIMCSSYKASLAAFVLSRVDRGEEKLDALVPYTAKDTLELWGPIAKANLARGTMTVEAMCKAAVEISDGACANLLMARSGGPAALTAFLRSIGDTVTRVDHYEPALDRVPSGGPDDSTTPAAMATTLRKVIVGNVLSDRSKALLTSWLVGNQTNPRLRGGLPRSWRIGNKTGHSGRDMAGDIAVAWPRPDTPIVIAVYTRGGRPSEKQFDKAFAGIGRLVAKSLT
ncbi:class A beta-lactamase [Sphingomonas sp. Leaf343]|uniref:class A beta-lactamase n=1 Tax=Sphingomonas sp. Leaf343 TaxID=1736345 RepID=UPI0006F394A6|nr:class A beta-lactamase [Sphingomonas sp. Leaf343]KQR83747.1 class A beta-lactamase [Sphingomonas sp. Leaf343]